MLWLALWPNARASCKAARRLWSKCKIANPLTVAIEEIVAGKVTFFISQVNEVKVTEVPQKAIESADSSGDGLL